MSNSALGELPKDAQLVALIMKSMDIAECEPQVIPQLLEFMYRHATEVLQDAVAYAEHAGHSEIAMNDLRFAIHSRSTHSFIPPPSRDLLLEIASKKNAEPLPLLKEDRYLHLPPDEYCLFGQQAQVVGLSSALPTARAAPRDARASTEMQ